MITVGLILTVSLLCAEYLIRKILPQKIFSEIQKTSLNCYQSSEILAYEYIPGCESLVGFNGINIPVKINQSGLRGKEIAASKNYKRLMLLGDSFVFGYGVEDSERIGDLVEKQFGNIEVISAGFLGDAGPDTAYSFLVNRGLDLQPDIIVLALFPYNDLKDIKETVWKNDDGRFAVSSPYKWIDKNGSLRRRETPWRYKFPIIRDSHFGQLVIDRLDKATKLFRTKLSMKLGLWQEGKTQHELFKNCLYQGICQENWLEASTRLGLILDKFQETADKYKIPFLTVIIPLKEQVAGEASQRTIFHQALENKQIEYLDLTESLRSSGLELSQLYLPDGHWSAYGHKTAAAAISPFILEYLEK